MTPLRLSHLSWQELQHLKASLGLDLIMKGDTVTTFINLKESMGQLMSELMATLGKVTDLRDQVSHRAWELMGSSLLSPITPEQQKKVGEAKGLINLFEEMLYVIKEAGEKGQMVINHCPTWLYDIAAGFRYKVGEFVQLGESMDWGWIKERRTISLSNNRTIYGLTIELCSRPGTYHTTQESVKDIMGSHGNLHDFFPGDYVTVDGMPGVWGQIKSIKVDRELQKNPDINAPYAIEVLLDGNELTDQFHLDQLTKIKPQLKETK